MCFATAMYYIIRQYDTFLPNFIFSFCQNEASTKIYQFSLKSFLYKKKMHHEAHIGCYHVNTVDT